MDTDKLKYWVGFNTIQGIGPTRFRRLLNHFGDLQAAWSATALDLAAAGLNRRGIENAIAARSRLDLDAEIEKSLPAACMLLPGTTPITRAFCAPYPRRRLCSMCSAAWRLRTTGQWPWWARAGRQLMAAKWLLTWPERWRATVSRWSAAWHAGIDGIAHRSALDAGGRTIAALGCGVDVVYPPEHARLAHDVAAHGALVSEYPLGTQPEARNFPPRNRIISGLSLGVLVAEGAEDSGSMITADYALEQGRDVFAVPGSIFATRSQGTNRLIQQGAKMVTSVQDILEELNLVQASQQMEVRSFIPDTPAEAALLEQLSSEPRHMDEIVRATGLPTSEVSATLAMMELKGMVRQVASMTYIIARS